ncbi:MAG: S8 family peptidase [Candidatus Thorarchaeota archaeon]|jgi:serine protease
MGKKKQNKHVCNLPPYEVEPVLTLQDAKQRAGWNITAFDLPKAWRKTGAGAGVVVAVIDSGCDLNHPDLKNNLVKGKNFVNPKKPPHDDNKHGTHVSGIIAAEHNDFGMVGVAPKAHIMPIKVLDRHGSGSLENTAKGIRWAVDNGADIICMSLGAPMKLQQVRKAVQYANSKGVPCFVAAGNSGRTKEVFYPAAYPETIAIGSIDENFNRSNFSNTGKNLDFMAPGGDIFSTVPDDWYAVISGTSMACPFAVGVAALVLSFSRKNGNKITLKCAEDYRKIFREHTIPIKDKKYGGKKFFQGYGIIDPRKFMSHLKQVKM